MKCPKCGMELIEIKYQGIKVDKCWACEGIWLDAGELNAVSRFEKTVLDKMNRGLFYKGLSLNPTAFNGPL